MLRRLKTVVSSPPYEYETARIEVANETTIGSVQYDEIFQRVLVAKANRKDKKSNLTSTQYWFETRQQRAGFRQSGRLISQARECVEFYDPYFADLQITQFALKAEFRGINIKIITSKLAFPEIERARNMMERKLKRSMIKTQA